jgi:hypothetical protein
MADFKSVHTVAGSFGAISKHAMDDVEQLNLPDHQVSATLSGEVLEAARLLRGLVHNLPVMQQPTAPPRGTTP